MHLACAVFIPEVTFSDAKRLRIVEGISTIPFHRWAIVRNTLAFIRPVVGSLMPERATSSNVRCATNPVARSFGVATVRQSTISPAPGPAVTSLALRFKL